MRRYSEAPHPFIFDPDPDCPVRVHAGSTATHGLVVVGEAVRHLPYLLVALRELGKGGLGGDRVPYRMDRVFTEDGTDVLEYPRQSFFTAVRPTLLEVMPGRSRWGRFRVDLATPTRLMIDGRLSRRPSFFDVIEALARRVFLLSCFHCQGSSEPQWDPFLDVARCVKCLHSDLRWMDAERFSTRQKRRVPLGGVVGSMTCEGDFGLLENLLRAGEYVHVGKNATFGLGKLRVFTGGPS